MYGVFWHTVCFLSHILSSRFFSIYFQAQNMRCLHHVISFPLHCYAIDHNMDGIDHIPVSRTAMEAESTIWTRHSPITENPTTQIDDTGAPLNHLIRSGFVQAPRKGRTLQLIPQTSGIAPMYGLCVLLWIRHVFWHFARTLLLGLGVTGSFHRLLSPNRRCGKIATVYQHHPPCT